MMRFFVCRRRSRSRGLVLLSLALLQGCGAGPDADPSLSDQKIIAAQKADYPLRSCVVSGEALGDMGEPYDAVHEGRLIRFCCKPCVKEFRKEPDAYLAKIDAAASARSGDATDAEAHGAEQSSAAEEREGAEF